MKRVLLLFSLLFLLHSAFAQEYLRKEVALEQLIEELFPLQEEEVDYEDIYEALFQYYRSPLNLNTATRSELQSLYVLTDTQITSLLEHRNKFGSLLSLYELQSVANFDLPTIYKLLPFVYVPEAGPAADNRPLWKRIRQEDNSYLILRYERTLEPRKGYRPTENSSGKSSYAGTPDKLYGRYRLAHAQSFSLGFTFEKDAGEQIIWDPSTRRYGADFISGHFTLYNKGRFKCLSLGDYQLQFGQGLVLAGGLAIGKGSETITTLRRSSLGIRPYTSVMESGYLSGAAATYALHKRWQLTGFYALNRLDGTEKVHLNDGTGKEEAYISSISTTGFHRTPAEIAKKGSLLRQSGGAVLAYSGRDNNLQLGATLVGTYFDRPFIRNSIAYNQFEFRGSRHWNSSVYYSYYWQNLSFFGEAAHTFEAGSALVNGVIVSIGSKVELAMLHRNYARNFTTFYGNAFGENTRNSNERGMYWGIRLKPIRHWTLSAYYDRFSLPWLAYKVDAPSRGHEWLGRLAFTPTRHSQLYAQIRMEVKEKNQAAQAGKMNELTHRHRRQYLLHLDHQITKGFSLRSRLQMSSFQHNAPATYGYVLAQDIQWEKGKLSLSGRFALFDTDDYDNRQYIFEKNVLYAFSFPAYYGTGTRAYLVAQYSLHRKADVWCRVARTTYRDRNSIGSGLEEIEGANRTDISLQLRYRF